MRLLFAILALVGLLMMPVAASAGAAMCLGHGGGMVMSAGEAIVHHTEHAAYHSCCDEDGGPAKHDSKACARACAAMCILAVTLACAGVDSPLLIGSLRVEALPSKAFHTHPPPNLKRPPRTFA